MNELKGPSDGSERRIAIVASRFNGHVVAKLVDGASASLIHHGVPDDAVDLAWVPGAFEIPLVAERLARTGRYDAILCLGAVIRGETFHFDLVANEAARGVADVTRATGVPCIFEVLATDDLPQAESRAGGAHGNKGWEAAEAALHMVGLLEALPGGGAR